MLRKISYDHHGRSYPLNSVEAFTLLLLHVLPRKIAIWHFYPLHWKSFKTKSAWAPGCPPPICNVTPPMTTMYKFVKHLLLFITKNSIANQAICSQKRIRGVGQEVWKRTSLGCLNGNWAFLDLMTRRWWL